MAQVVEWIQAPEPLKKKQNKNKLNWNKKKSSNIDKQTNKHITKTNCTTGGTACVGTGYVKAPVYLIFQEIF
jgi:hypothetical protein